MTPRPRTLSSMLATVALLLVVVASALVAGAQSRGSIRRRPATSPR